MDFLILLAVFVALLALAYVTYRNISNLDSRLRRIEDVLKNAQVVAEPVSLPPSTGIAAANVSTNPSVARPVPSRSPSAPKTITHFQPPQTGSGADAGSGPGSGFGVPGWGGESAPSVPVHVERVSETEFYDEGEGVPVHDGIEIDNESVDGHRDGDIEIQEEAEDTSSDTSDDQQIVLNNKNIEADKVDIVSDEEDADMKELEREQTDDEKEQSGDEKEQSDIDDIVEEILSPNTQTNQVDADFDETELTLDDILSNMEQENLRSAPVSVSVSVSVPAPAPALPPPQIPRNHEDLKVAEIREILRKANVSIPANAKKSEMIALMKQKGL